MHSHQRKEHMNKLTEKHKDRIIKALVSGDRQRAVAARFGVSQQLVSQMWRKKLVLKPGERRGGDHCSEKYEERKIKRMATAIKRKLI